MYHQRLWQQIMGSIGAEENCQDYRDNSMPESPETKLAIHSLGPSALSLSPVVGMPPVTSRPMSSNSSLSGVGGHSPASHHGGGGGSLSGRTPSPPALSAALTTAASSQQLPPACGARQLSKLKRFLTTLQQFGSDISPEIGDRVRSLVLGLVNSHLSIEEFHAKLQEATNFPLRPFVIPFLKANLPLLQRELVHCARLAKQTPQQYLSQNEHILFDAAAAAAAGGAHSPSDSSQDLSTGPPEINENGKRKSPDRPKENGFEPPDLHPAKRAHTLSPGSVGGAPAAPRVSPGNHGSFSYPGGGGSLRLEDMSLNRELRERERLERERAERERHYSYNAFSRTEHYENIDRLEDDWRQVENMLHCIVGMVDKCKRALVSLQERSHRDREEATLWMRRHLDNLDNLGKRPANEHLGPPSGPPRAGDGGERMASEAKRRAHESAVNEVKRQAVVELQKAVASAEAKASELVSSERCKMERTVLEARKQAQDEVLSKLNHQEESSESCWNCGRKASETCSGCNVARYCGSFCQHKDWENHHRVCGQGLASARILEARSERQVPSVSQPGLDRNPPPTTTPVQASSPPPPVSQGPASPPASPQGRSPPSQRPPSLGQTSPGPPASDNSSSSTRQDSKPEQRSGHEQAA